MNWYTFNIGHESISIKEFICRMGNWHTLSHYNDPSIVNLNLEYSELKVIYLPSIKQSDWYSFHILIDILSGIYNILYYIANVVYQVNFMHTLKESAFII